MNAILIAIFIAIGAAGVLVAILFPYLSGRSAAEKRRASLVQGATKRAATGGRQVDGAQRRKQIADSLKELEEREKAQNRISLEQRIAQAGLRMSKSQFFMWSGVCGLVLGFGVFVLSESLPTAGACAFVGLFGLPRWALGFKRRRRLNRFVQAFPDAIDVIIRGVKAGLPLLDSLRVVAAEFPDPIRSEFLAAVEAQTVGLTITESVERIAERVPVPEARFFAILIGIQQKSGGNLSEGLGNLSRVLRDRKKIAQKIKAMSAEAKASAGIIGSLPFVVAALVNFTSPGYMDLLWSTSTGHMLLMISGLWMTMGVLVMKKMISFDV